MTIDSKHLIIGCIYLSPTYKYETLIELLTLTLNGINDKYPDLPIVIAGDFNANIGNLNQVDVEMLESSAIFSEKTSNPVTNKKGKLLVDCMEYQGLLVRNGRTRNDRPADHTHTHPQGSSVIDFVWINNNAINLVHNFQVDEEILISDHLICNTILSINKKKSSRTKRSEATTTSSYIKWDQTKHDAFYKEINNTTPIYNAEQRISNSHNMEKAYEELLDAIYSAAHPTDIICTRKLTTNYNNSNKTWYTVECRKLKQKMRVSYRNFKKHPKDQSNLERFWADKKHYKQNIINSKKDYYNEIKFKINNIKDP